MDHIIADNGSVGHGSLVKWVTNLVWVTWVMGNCLCQPTHHKIHKYQCQKLSDQPTAGLITLDTNSNLHKHY